MEPAPALDEPPPGAVVSVFDETSGRAAGLGPLDPERLAGLAAAVLRGEGITAGELGLRFVDHGAMAELNLIHMGASGPTDVLAFPIDGAGGGTHLSGAAPLLGDVVVCPEYAAARLDGAIPPGGGVPAVGVPAAVGVTDGGLDLLVVHGVLHILGYDHAHEADAAAMRAREQHHLAAHSRQP